MVSTLFLECGMSVEVTQTLFERSGMIFEGDFMLSADLSYVFSYELEDAVRAAGDTMVSMLFLECVLSIKVTETPCRDARSGRREVADAGFDGCSLNCSVFEDFRLEHYIVFVKVSSSFALDCGVVVV